ncbi:MAG: plastocyanin/azurin family copper-binding protein [Dehalococcoidia bacterium]
MKLGKGMPIAVLTLVAAVGVTVGLVAALDGGSGGAALEEEAVHQEEAGHAGVVREIVVQALERSDGLFYTPNEIHIEEGEQVRLIVDNTAGATLHDLTIEDMEAHIQGAEGAEHGGDGGHVEAALHVAAAAGEKGMIEFTAEKAGNYVFYCSVPGHRLAGMEGTVTVEA